MIAVKIKSQLRAPKSNTDLTDIGRLCLINSVDWLLCWGRHSEPTSIVVVILLLSDQPIGVSHVFITQSRADSVSVSPGLDKRRVISCYEAGMKYPFAYVNVVTEPRLLIASVLVYICSLLFRAIWLINAFSHLINFSSFFLSRVFIIFCHLKVYCITRRHEKLLADQQVTPCYTRGQTRKALKLTCITFWEGTPLYKPYRCVTHQRVFAPFWSGIGYGFRGIYGSVRAYLSFWF